MPANFASNERRDVTGHAVSGEMLKHEPFVVELIEGMTPVMPDTSPYEKYIDLTTGRSRYLEAGAGMPLILLHGMGIAESANVFDPILEDLAKEHHVFVLDMLGFGLGTRSVEEGPTFSLVVEHIREFMDALRIDKANFLGHSAGGWMSGLLAYESPNRVNRLVMMCSAGLNAKPPSGIHLAEIPSREQIEQTIRQEYFDQTTIDNAMMRQIADTRQRALAQTNALHSLDPLLHQMHTSEIRARYLLHRRLPHIGAPALVIWGEGCFMDPYPTWVAEYASLNGDMSKSTKPWVIPGARYVMLPTGHYPHWELPQRTATFLLDFFRS